MKEIVERLKQSTKALIITHKDADGDALGSVIAMKFMLKQIAPEAKIFTHIDPNYRKNLKYWVEKYGLQMQIAANQEFDTVVALDSGVRKRIIFPKTHKNIDIDINIDHHLDDPYFGKINLTLPDRASVGVILYEIIQDNNLKITPEIAEGIYLSVYTDTGCFSFSNTDERAFKCAAAAIELGKLNPHLFYSHLFESAKYDDLVTFGKAVSSAKKTCNGKVIWAQMHPDELDSRELIDFIRRDGECLVAVVFVQEKDSIKISLRSKGNINIAKIAKRFNGGGHKNAAACRILTTDIEEAKKQLLGYLEAAL